MTIQDQNTQRRTRRVYNLREIKAIIGKGTVKAYKT